MGFSWTIVTDPYKASALSLFPSQIPAPIHRIAGPLLTPAHSVVLMLSD
jgi:hypothetical protein